MQLFKRHTISELTLNLSREDLLRRSRILVVDDEKPKLIEDLQRLGFAIDHVPDITPENIHRIERRTYDLIILDFGNVGTSFGSDEGLSLLLHIKRLYPSLTVFAYTSKALKTEHSDFYRKADGVLSKDAGIQESMAEIEEGLRFALSIPNLWAGMLHAAGIRPGSKEDLDLQDLYVKSLTKPNKRKLLTEKVTAAAGAEGTQTVGKVIAETLIEVGVKAVIGA